MTDEMKSIFLQETDSSNNYAKRYIADQKEDDAVLFLAAKQTAGRGRQGNRFFSPEGGLYMSLLLPADFHLQAGLSLTSAVAVAVCEVLQTFAVQAQIKWVNDIYWQGKKLGGILCESVQDMQDRSRYIIGIGINLQTPAEGFPEEICDKAIALDLNIMPADLAEKLANCIMEIISAGLSHQALYENYKSLSLVLGRRIIFIEKGIEYSAQVLEINRDGSLKILSERGIESLSGGEISLLI